MYLHIKNFIIIYKAKPHPFPPKNLKFNFYLKQVNHLINVHLSKMNCSERILTTSKYRLRAALSK